MSPSVTYLPAYLGLYASLVLAIVCNTFLDIQYGGFFVESLLWAGLYAWTLNVGWRQQGEESDEGRAKQKAVVVVGLIVSVLIFIPMWGPRGGVYILAMLQAANNCVTTTRRRLYLGLLVSVVMVMFAANHHRADWTMLFYLLPYLVAVVFTLVAEQVSRRAQDIAGAGPARAVVGGQGAAIAAATAAILAIAGLLYATTPQVTWPYLQWRFGQPTNLGHIGGAQVDAGQGGEGGMSVAPGGAGGGQGESAGEGEGMTLKSGLPSIAEMRKAAGRSGMPEWQSAAITSLADLAESLDQVLAPVMQSIAMQWQSLLDWLKQHWRELLLGLLGLILAALLLAAALLLRESRPGIWLLSWFDYLRLGLFAFHAPGNTGARQYFHAMERFLVLHGVERMPAENTREYLQQLSRRHEHLRREFAELVLLFEKARYGAAPVDAVMVRRMRELYRNIHWKADALTG